MSAKAQSGEAPARDYALDLVIKQLTSKSSRRTLYCPVPPKDHHTSRRRGAGGDVLGGTAVPTNQAHPRQVTILVWPGACNTVGSGGHEL
jgi:hypothetical protein